MADDGPIIFITVGSLGTECLYNTSVLDTMEDLIMAEAIEYVYYKKNVGFSVGVRFFPRDPDGVVLNNQNPYVNIKKEDEKNFLQANKQLIARGLIIKTEEPSFDFVTENTITDEDAEEVVKNLFILKKRLPTITSEATLGKLHEAAVRQGRSKKIITMIEERLEDVTPVGMQGTEWGVNNISGGE